MAALSRANSRVDDIAMDESQDLKTIGSVKQQSMYKTPDNYFFHAKTHIDEGDIVIVFMVSSSCPSNSVRFI